MRYRTSWRMSYRNGKWLTRVNPNVRRGLLHVMATVKPMTLGENGTVNGCEKNITAEETTSQKSTTAGLGEENKIYNRCLRCGKKLKNPEYRIRGYGKICWEKKIKEKKQSLF